MLKYKSYFGIAEYDEEGKIFTGEVIGLSAVITFQGRTPEELENSFRESIDLYLAMCLEDGISSEKAYSGRFNIRLDPALHRQLADRARLHRKSLNEYVAETLSRHLD